MKRLLNALWVAPAVGAIVAAMVMFAIVIVPYVLGWLITQEAMPGWMGWGLVVGAVVTVIVFYVEFRTYED